MKPRKPVSGIEFEYAFGASDKNGARIPFSTAYDGIEDWARRNTVHLRGDHRPGIFLPNGSFFYRDPASGGAHLEHATCEFTNPRDGVLASGAAHLHMRRCLEGWHAENPLVGEAAFFRTSFDYTLQTSWATHFSGQMHHSSHGRRVPWLVGLLVSKVIFGGSGGFRPGGGSLEFCLSPRLYTFDCIDCGGDTERHRGLLGCKGSHHSTSGNMRLHLIGFECLCGQLPRYLEIGSLQLAMLMMDHNVVPPDVQLKNPMEALRTFAMDPACRKKVALEGGGKVTAVEIQRRYLEAARSSLSESWMPEWAEGFCNTWSRTLDLFADAPRSLAPLLDWAAKFSLFEDYAQRHAGGSWDTAAPALMELDMRFGQISTSPSIFDEMERSGLITSRLFPEEEVVKAMEQPPADTRARLRGEAVRTLHAGGGHGCASWTMVFDEAAGRVLRLQDPHTCSGVEWQSGQNDDVPPRRRDERWLQLTEAHRRQESAMENYDRGRFATVLSMLSPSPFAAHAESHSRSLRAWTLARLGDAAAWDELRALENQRAVLSTDHVVDELLVRRFMCLLPPSSTERWIVMGESILAARPGHFDPFFHLGAGALLCRMARAPEGMAHLTTVNSSTELVRRLHHRLRARALADEAEAHRMLGDAVKAHQLLTEAMTIQRREGYAAELADFSMACQARLVEDPAEARRILADAMILQTRCQSRTGLARSLLMDARLAGPAGSGQTHRERLSVLTEQASALAVDETLRRITAHWEAWTGGAPDPAGGSLATACFWGL